MRKVFKDPVFMAAWKKAGWKLTMSISNIANNRPNKGHYSKCMLEKKFAERDGKMKTIRILSDVVEFAQGSHYYKLIIDLPLIRRQQIFADRHWNRNHYQPGPPFTLSASSRKPSDFHYTIDRVEFPIITAHTTVMHDSLVELLVQWVEALEDPSAQYIYVHEQLQRLSYFCRYHGEEKRYHDKHMITKDLGDAYAIFASGEPTSKIKLLPDVMLRRILPEYWNQKIDRSNIGESCQKIEAEIAECEKYGCDPRNLAHIWNQISTNLQIEGPQFAAQLGIFD